MPKLDIQTAIEEAVSLALTDQAIRIGAILRSPDAEGRRDLALTMALNSTLSADSALAMLRSAPREHASADRFIQAMNAEGPLNLGPAHVAVATDKKAARLLEIKDAAKAVRAQRGYGTAK